MSPYHFLIGLAFLPSYILAQNYKVIIHPQDSIIIRTDKSRYLLPQDSTLIVDVRTPDEFVQAHYPGALNLQLDTLIGSEEILKKYKNVVVVCRTGKRSKKAKAVLEQNGLENVYDGGDWQILNE